MSEWGNYENDLRNLSMCLSCSMCISCLLQVSPYPPPDFYGDHLTSAEQTTPILPEGLRSGPLLGPCVHIIKPQISSWHLGTIIAPQKHEASIRLPAAWQLIPTGHVCSGDRNCSLLNQDTQIHVWMGLYSYLKANCCRDCFTVLLRK